MNSWTGVVGGHRVSFALIADGHGGAEAAEWCARNTLYDVIELSGCNASASSLRDACIRAFVLADEGVRALLGGTCKAGCTLTVVCVNATLGEVTCAAVGDSLAYLVPHRPRGTPPLASCPLPQLMTTDHRLNVNADERQRVEAEDCIVARAADSLGNPTGPLRAWPGGVAFARAIGDADCGARVPRQGQASVARSRPPPSSRSHSRALALAFACTRASPRLHSRARPLQRSRARSLRMRLHFRACTAGRVQARTSPLVPTCARGGFPRRTRR